MQEQHIKSRYPTLTQVSILYSIVMLVFITMGARLQRAFEMEGKVSNFGLVLSEIVIILIPPLVLLYMKRYNLKETLRIRWMGWKEMILVFLIILFSIPAVNIINALYIMFLEKMFGKIDVFSMPPAKNVWDLVLGVIIIGGIAGICEEVLFRGTIQRGFERFGRVSAVWISAFLFGLMHLRLDRFFGTFLLGLLIGYMVYRTNSIFSGIMAHFMNNTAAVIQLFLAEKSGQLLKAQEQMQKDGLLNGISIEQLVAVGFILFILGTIIFGLIISLREVTAKTLDQGPVERSGSLFGLLWLSPGLILCGAAYVFEILYYLHIDNHFLRTIFEAFGLIQK